MGKVQVYRTVEDVRDALKDAEVAFVPTMGSLHAGHISLVRAAAQQQRTTVVSIFVNPTQFNDSNDFEKYPRDLEADLASLENTGCEVVFAPDPSEIYPANDATTISVAGISEPFEGKHRPGHFDGVATVVTKLFLIVQPNVAIFGEKDWQQCLVVQRLIADLRLPIRLMLIETMREQDGLAMSSRNARLTPEQRLAAPVLYQCLVDAAHRSRAGESSADIESTEIEALTKAGFKVEYFSIVHPGTLQPASGPGSRIVTAAWLGDVRLIDNLAV